MFDNTNWYSLEDGNKFDSWLETVEDIEWSLCCLLKKSYGMEKVLRSTGANEMFCCFTNRKTGQCCTYLFTYEIPNLKCSNMEPEMKILIQPNFQFDEIEHFYITKKLKFKV